MNRLFALMEALASERLHRREVEDGATTHWPCSGCGEPLNSRTAETHECEEDSNEQD